MKVVILAGGFGTRISEYTHSIPKPMVQIGDKPILWHIMKYYSSYGFDEFIILLGYKGNIIRNYFLNYLNENADIEINLKNDEINILNNITENWQVRLIDTGLNDMTGSRLIKAQKHIGNNTFMLTYGDGLSDINLKKLMEFHKKKGLTVTLTAVQPTGRFGSITLDDDNNVQNFMEKPKGDGSWVNGGFFICEPGIFNYLKPIGADLVFERQPLEKASLKKQLAAYKHHGFWQCMDTLHHKKTLETLWDSDNAPWKIW